MLHPPGNRDARRAALADGPKSQFPESVSTDECDMEPIEIQDWPDIHDHISQLTDAAVLPSEEDGAARCLL
jgi:hypothetical protein